MPQANRTWWCTCHTGCRSYNTNLKQDPNLDKGYGICDMCFKEFKMEEEWMRYGWSSDRPMTKEEVAAWREKYA